MKQTNRQLNTIAQWHVNLMLLIGVLRVGAIDFDPELRTRLQLAIDSVQRAENIQGVSAAVIIGNDAWAGGSGASHEGRPLTPDMLLGIGSNTKTCTAVTLLRLHERGVLDLDDAVGKWIPAHPNIDSAITLRQLLHHSSGVGDYSELRAYRDACLAEPTRMWTSSELLALIPPREFEPGSSWSYSNSNYFLAALAAEAASGMSMHQLYRRELFDALALDSTRLFPQERLIGELAHRWMGGRDAAATPMTAEWSGAGAAGAVISTSSEMVQFYDALFHGKVITQESLDQLTDFDGPNQYGLGISRKVISGEVVIGHSGEIRGYSSLIFWIPTLQASVSVLTNSIPSNPLAVAAAIVRVLRDQTTSVQDDVGSTRYSLPADVYALSGQFICRVTSTSHMLGLLPGIYVLNAASPQLVCITSDNTVCIGR